MVKQTTPDKESSSIIWNNLEEMVRLKVRDFIQTLLEAEIEELLGRQKSERRQIADSSDSLSEWLWERAETDPGLRDD